MEKETCFFECPVGTKGGELVTLLTETQISYKLFSLSSYEVPVLCINRNQYYGYETIKSFLMKRLQAAPVFPEPGGVST